MRFQFDTVIDLPGDVLFAFHEDPEHLVLLHRGWASFRMLHHDGCIRIGSRTWFATTIAGIVPVVLGFEHTVYDPPHRFGECLVHGPFRRFSHVHEFTDVDGRTNCSDRLDVELPWYYGGEIVMKLFVAPCLRRAFRLRGEALEELAQSGSIVGKAADTSA
jgi:ligand-binding SRPBCC domain-containing protein